MSDLTSASPATPNMIKLEILDKDGTVRMGKNEYEEHQLPMAAQGEEMAFIATQELVYQEGDFIRVTTDAPGRFLVVKLDETLDSSLIYLNDVIWEYEIPLSEGARNSIPDMAFMSKSHYLSVRYAKDYEIKQYRNLALNPHDQKDSKGAYPHAYANVETRNDSTFFAKNAIDGVYANNSHGQYPYQSWGINRDPNAEFTIDFGRNVRIDSAGIVLRADFPHDSFWRQVTLRFEDGTTYTFATEKKTGLQMFNFPAVVTRYAVLEKLIKADDESPFPALTQLELYGTEE